ncbi:MAG: Rieske 2Fe-2S domain-containing protein [Bacteroidetes bacterium]|jgi:choline monooxygenase|nr:Rieske 2Fe-2S domain-containing protein [Bacteroidota bacterium]
MPLPDLTAETLRTAPLARAETIPSSWYVDPRMHAFEQDAVFARTWQLVGHVGQMPSAGDYLTAAVAGNPVVVVRDRDDGLRAFYNVCRHRGGPLATARCGHARMLQCQYHGWTYRLDGSLRGVPRFDRTELFDKRDYGLVPLAVDTWQGLVFVRLEDGAGSEIPPLLDVVDGIAGRIAPLRLDRLRFARRVTYDVACNWKVYVDNYLEGYHLPLVHPELCDRLDVRGYTTETFRWYSLQHSGLRGGGDGYYGTDASDDDAAYYYFLFPNVMLNILPGRLQTNIVEPVAASRCRVHFDYFYTDGASEQRIDEDVAFSDRVQQEDVDICEHVQRGLASRAYDRGRFSVEAEAGVYHFQCLLKDAYRAALDQEDVRTESGVEGN